MTMGCISGLRVQGGGSAHDAPARPGIGVESVRIPVKLITDSGVKPITDSGQTGHLSERSDAGLGL